MQCKLNKNTVNISKQWNGRKYIEVEGPYIDNMKHTFYV